ncbi:MAG TPA: DUF3592 domain-containing protein [Thermoanaerobaculia bacterium]|nr:DUF3592 domain-containing protein [Thermoanaerobaculia bacterium]
MKLRLERGDGGARGILPSVVASLVFLVCIAAGGFGTWATAADWLRIVASHGWSEVPCEIEASRVVEDDSGYRLAVQYRYRYAGREYRSAVVSPRYTGSTDFADAQRRALRYPAGTTATCLVDPGAPGDASLERDSLGRGILVLATFAFFAVGVGGLWILWGGTLPAGLRTRPEGRRPKRPSLGSRAASAAGGRGCLTGFFALFLAAGLGFFVPFFGLPAARVVAARGWQPVPCTIERSGVATHAGDDGNTYSIDVLYSYEHGAQTLRGNRYGFLSGSTSSYEGKAEVVAGLPPGTRTTCWVDPDDPVASVIERGFTVDFLFGLLPLVFVAVGAGGMVFAWKGAGGAVPVLAEGPRGRSARGSAGSHGQSGWLPRPQVSVHRPGRAEIPRRRRGSPPAPTDSLALPSAVVLEAPYGPVAKFFGLLAIAAFWNGIVGVFLYQVVIGWRTGAGDGCLTLFLVPFVLVGALLLVSVPHQFLALFNPRPRLVLSAATAPVGGTLLLEWSFRGAAGRIRRLRIVLEGREEATYRRGTSSSTSSEVFAEIPIVDHARPHPLASGHATIHIPADTMHSFTAKHNRIAWSLKLTGEIRSWPDVDQEYELVVTPQEVG